MGVRKSLAVFFDGRNCLKSVRHLHGVRRPGIPFHAPLDLHDLGAFGKELAIGGKSLAVCIHHHVIGDDHFQLGVSLADRDNLPVLVSFEIGKCQFAQFQRVAVLLGVGDAGAKCERRCAEQRDDSKSHVELLSGCKG